MRAPLTAESRNPSIGPPSASITRSLSQIVSVCQAFLHFEKRQMPPVNEFWSLTMYDAEYFFVANPLDRYTLSSRNKLKTNADGSVDLYLQNENPVRTRSPIGCRLPKAGSFRCCGSTGLRRLLRRCWTGRGQFRE